MAYDRLHCIYFSATGTTLQIAKAICKGTACENIVFHNLLLMKEEEEKIIIDSSELVIFAVPVYSGRVPAIAIPLLNSFVGNGTPAIIVCVYGNRDYEDALLELHDIVRDNGFVVISAAAFVAQHSIFPAVANGRPDVSDMTKAIDFGCQSVHLLQRKEDFSIPNPIIISGNYPFRSVKPIPLKPKTNKQCNKCGRCARECPAHAIDINNPRQTDSSLCISCAHCIAICPVKARHFGGFLYQFAARKFCKKYTERREPYMVYR